MIKSYIFDRSLSEEDLEKVMEHLRAIEKIIDTQSRHLAKEERKGFSRRQDRHQEVSKTKQDARSIPETVPPVRKIQEMGTSFERSQDLDRILHRARHLVSNLEDSRIIAGTVAYRTWLKIYHLLGNMLSTPFPGIIPALKTLRKYFVNRGRKPGKGFPSKSGLNATQAPVIFSISKEGESATDS